MSMTLQTVLRFGRLNQKLVIGIVFICVFSSVFLLHPNNFSLSEINYTSPLEGYKHTNQYYQGLFNKWLNYDGSSGHESDFITDDNVLGDIVRNVFVEDQMFPGGEYGFNIYEVDKKDIKGQFGQPLIVDKILDKKRNGFFIEAGGADGLHLSNTLYFELFRNFTGVLIEPSSNYTTLRQRNRKVKSLNVCLSRKSIPEIVTFLDASDIGGIEGEVKGWAKDFVNSPNTTRITKVCLPLHSILAALGNPKVDYFSLDVEGVELDILKSIPWNKVDIDIFSIEVSANGRSENEVCEFMRKSGYTKVVSELEGTEDIFVRSDFRSPFFGDEQKPKLIKYPNGYDFTRMGSALLCNLFNNCN